MANYTLWENGLITVTYPAKEKYIPDQSNGLKTKTFGIDWEVYRKLTSAAVNAFENKVNKLVFLTLTFPFAISEKDANRVFSEFVNRFKKNYNLYSYVAVKELHESGNPHFHGLFDFPFLDIRRINDIWCSCFPSFGCYSRNAVRLPEGKNRAVVHSIFRVVRYFAKYVSKGRGRRYSARCFFVSRNIASRPRKITHEEFLFISDTFRCVVYKNDYSSTVVVKNTLFPMRKEFESRKIESARQIQSIETTIKILLAKKKELEKKLKEENLRYRQICDEIENEKLNPVVISPKRKKNGTSTKNTSKDVEKIG